MREIGIAEHTRQCEASSRIVGRFVDDRFRFGVGPADEVDNHA
jgi:hypothetical protein